MSFAPAGDPVLVAVHGELDLVSGGRVRDRLREALAASSGGLELDLSGLGFCDCAGLNVLMELRHQAVIQGKTVTIQDSSPAIDRLLDLVGAQELFSAPRPRCAKPRRRGPVTVPSPPGTPPGVGAPHARSLTPCVSGSA
ncbi:STAS domain-containing protein [Streptomyces sp. NPDC058751]|uniref:STAS domain-containing protein n=1 Tax=Streptomyces sp. NPDC058751 TaxID=3346623 RepID=UPI0036778826